MSGRRVVCILDRNGSNSFYWRYCFLLRGGVQNKRKAFLRNKTRFVLTWSLPHILQYYIYIYILCAQCHTSRGQHSKPTHARPLTHGRGRAAECPRSTPTRRGVIHTYELIQCLRHQPIILGHGCWREHCLCIPGSLGLSLPVRSCVFIYISTSAFIDIYTTSTLSLRIGLCIHLSLSIYIYINVTIYFRLSMCWNLCSSLSISIYPLLPLTLFICWNLCSSIYIYIYIYITFYFSMYWTLCSSA